MYFVLETKMSLLVTFDPFSYIHEFNFKMKEQKYSALFNNIGVKVFNFVENNFVKSEC